MASRGLPSNPRPRTKSTPAPPTNRPPVQPRALPANSRSRPPPLSQRERTSDPTPPPLVSRWNSPSNVSPPRRTLDRSPTSSTSSASSSSVRSWGTSSSASSRTTLQSEVDFNTQDLNGGCDTHTKDLKHSHSYSSNDVKDAVGFGWGKVTEVANVFTQEVSKVWATGLNPLMASDGLAEDESELTRVMRAYHLSKARHPSDLPNWLFSERERGQLGGLVHPEVHSDDSQAPRQRNRPDMAATRNPDPRLIRNPPTPTNRLPPMKTSGTDRLRMLRERRDAANNRI